METGKNLKIIFITNDLLFAHQHLYHILNYLTEVKNHKVFLLSGNMFKNNYIFPPKVNLINLSIMRKPHLKKDISTIYQIVCFLKNKEPDLMFSFTPKGGFLSIIASLFLKKILHIHTFTGQVWANNFGIKSRFYCFLDSLIALRTNLSLADSESQAIFLNKNLYFSNNVVGLKDGSLSGIDHNRFNKKFKKDNILDIKKIGINYLFLGRINLDKGIEDLIKIIPKHLSIFKNDKFTIVGPIEDQKIFLKLKNLREKWAGKVFINDFTKTPEFFLKDSDTLLLPSRREGFGNIIIEAAACGVPTISYDIYGIKNSLKKNVTGLSAKPFNIGEFESLMRICSRDKYLVKNLSDKAYSFSKKFNHEERTKIFINSIIENTTLREL